MPGYEAANWFGIVAPGRHAAGHRREAAQGDHGDPGLPEVQKQFDTDGADDRADELPRSSAPSWSPELDKWERVVKEGGIKAQ